MISPIGVDSSVPRIPFEEGNLAIDPPSFPQIPPHHLNLLLFSPVEGLG